MKHPEPKLPPRRIVKEGSGWVGEKSDNVLHKWTNVETGEIKYAPKTPKRIGFMRRIWMELLSL
jgi:hypothetical protein